MSSIRTRWAAIGAAVAVTLGGGGVALVGAASGDEQPVTVLLNEPCRLRDTRPNWGVGGRITPIGPNEAYTVQGTGVSGDCNVPADAVGLITNVTAVLPTAPTDLRLYPTGVSVPGTSNLNPAPGQPPTPNSVTVGLSPSGQFDVLNKFGTVHVIIDVAAYLVDHEHDDRYYTETEIDDLLDAITAGEPTGYEHVIVVAQSGGDFTSVTDAMNAIGADPSYPASSSTERYLVWVAPGVYENEDVDMQPYVDIEGSGQGVTVLTSVRNASGFGPDAATLVGADNAELRHLTVEASGAGGNWSHAIYTAAGTSFKNVTARSTDGQRSRGIFVDTGGRAIMIDVVMVATGASSSNIGLDVYQGMVFADGLFADVAGGIEAKGILITDASSEVQIENVTTHANDGSDTTIGLETTNSSATIEGLRSIVNGESTSYGTVCNGAGYTVRMIDATIYSGTGSASQIAGGVNASDCNLEIRNAVIDAVAAGGDAFGVTHTQADTVTAADVTIADVESRAWSGGASAYGISMSSSGGSPAGTYGRVTDLNTRATGGSASSSTWGINHSAVGEVQYRGLSIIVEGTGGFMYGIQTTGDGVPKFHDVVIDAFVEADFTIFGVEFQTDASTLTNAKIRAVNLGNDNTRDAVGIKALNASDVTFTDVTAYAEAETNVWGADLVGSVSRLVRVDAHAVSTDSETTTDAGVALTRCVGGSAEVHDSILRAASSASSSYGYNSDDCNSTITDSELIANGASTNYGLFADSTSGIDTTSVRGSHVVGSTASVYTTGVGAAEVYIVMSQLDGADTSSFGTSDSQRCTAVTYNWGVMEAFSGSEVDCTTL